MQKLSHIILIIMLAAAALQAAGAQQEAQDMEGVIYDGIDVSSYQEDIDWSATAADRNIKFVYVKATEGATYRSRHYAFNIENARKYGIKVGSYHFFRPKIAVQKQFDNFTSVVKKEDQDLVPLIDVETRYGVTPQQLVDSVLLFARMLQRHYGCRPMIYTGVAFYNSYLRGHFDGYKLFIARYSRFAPKVMGAKWTLWQFSERGRIAGIDHNVDLCRFNVGAGLHDILIPGRRAGRQRHGGSQQAVPPPPKKQPKQQEQEVPLTKKQKKELERQRKEAQKRAKEQAKLRKQQQADSLKQVREAQKRAEKARKEEQKRQAKLQEKQRKEAQKRAQEQAKKQKQAQEQAQKQRAKLQEQQKQALEQAKKQQQAQEAAKKKQQQQAAAKKKQQQQQAAKRTSANDRAKRQGKRVNQSSADNDD